MPAMRFGFSVSLNEDQRATQFLHSFWTEEPLVGRSALSCYEEDDISIGSQSCLAKIPRGASQKLIRADYDRGLMDDPECELWLDGEEQQACRAHRKYSLE